MTAALLIAMLACGPGTYDPPPAPPITIIA